MNQALILSEIKNGIAVVTLNNPSRRNALSHSMLEALGSALDSASRNPDCRVIVLKAEGPVFSAGHDLKEMVSCTTEQHAELFRLCSEVMDSIRKLPQPVIAMVNGLATAAGCQLAASCDLVVASESASFATPGVKIGLFCSTPAVALSRALSTKKAMEMLLTGEPMSASEAERSGLVNRVVPSDRLEQVTLELAARIAQSSADTVRLGKSVFYAQLPCDRQEAYAIASEAMVRNASMYDAKEGMTAFLEKRKPVWKQDATVSCE